jgi:hypothetical protein
MNAEHNRSRMVPFYQETLSSTLSPRAFPAVLFVLCAVTYGLLSPWLGFHWDDHFILVPANIDFSSMLKFWEFDRPATAYFHYWVQTLFGNNPFLWHILAMLFRWLGALIVWLLLIEFFKGRRFDCAAIASLFLIYPGFRYQSASVTFSVNLLHQALVLSSILLMVYSLKVSSHKVLFIVGAVLTGSISMLLNEYHLGYELFRPIVFWYFINDATSTYRVRVKQCLKAWVPYGLMLGAYMLYRYLFLDASERLETDPGYFFSMLQNNWYKFVVERIGLVFPNLIDGVFLSWLQAFSAGGHKTGSIYGLFGLPIGILAGLIWHRYVYASCGQPQNRSDAFDYQDGQRLLLLGLLLFFLGGLPLWYAGISLSVYDAHGRFTFPVMLGSSIVLFSILKLTVAQPRLRNVALSILIGLGVAIQIEAQNDFRRSWHRSTMFFSQLELRAPALEKGTLLIIDAKVPSWDTTSIPAQDLGIPLNALYAEGVVTPDFQYWAIPIGEVDDGSLNLLANSSITTPIQFRARYQNFSGQIGKHLVITYYPPKCLRVLDPDQPFELIHNNLTRRVNDSNFSLIRPRSTTVGAGDRLDTEREEFEWCHYFQLVELANQYRDWEKVLELTGDVIAKNLGPVDTSEWKPFLRGLQESGDPQAYKRLSEYIRLKSS